MRHGEDAHDGQLPGRCPVEISSGVLFAAVRDHFDEPECRDSAPLKRLALRIDELRTVNREWGWRCRCRNENRREARREEAHSARRVESVAERVGALQIA